MYQKWMFRNRAMSQNLGTVRGPVVCVAGKGEIASSIQWVVLEETRWSPCACQSKGERAAGVPAPGRQMGSSDVCDWEGGVLAPREQPALANLRRVAPAWAASSSIPRICK